MANGTTCPYHEDRGKQLTEIEKKVSAHEVEIDAMKADTIVLFGKVERAADKHEAALDRLCAEVKTVKVLVGGVQAEQGRLAKEISNGDAAASEKMILENEPIGWLNSALRKMFRSQAFWIVVAWVLIKILLFGEYPAFSGKVRPYMKPVISSQQALDKQLHESGIIHSHDTEGHPIPHGEEKK